jgi:WD40 repeat protein
VINVWKNDHGFKLYKQLTGTHTGDIEIAKILKLPETHKSALTSGSYLVFSACYDCTAVCWDLETEQPIRTFADHTRPVWCLDSTYRPDGTITLVTGAVDNTIRVWDVENAKCLHIIPDHRAAVRCIQLFTMHGSDELMIASGSYDCFVFISNMHTVISKYKHNATVIGLQLFEKDEDTYMVTCCFDSKLRLFNLTTGSLVRTFHGHTAGVFSMHVVIDYGLIVSGSKDLTIRVWDLNESKSFLVLKPAHISQRINGIQMKINSDGSITIISAQGTQVSTLDFDPAI